MKKTICILVGLFVMSSQEVPAVQYTLTPLGELSPEHDACIANDTNDYGQIAGTCFSSDPANMTWKAFRWENGLMTDLGYLAGCNRADGNGIDSSGRVVGECGPGNGSEAFLWESGALTPLGFLPPGTSSWALAVSDAGQIVGMCHIDTGVREACRWEDGGSSVSGPFGLGDLAGGTHAGAALDNNEAGQIVGYSYSTDGLEAFLWENDTMSGLGDLPGGTFGSIARAINNLGQVVGEGRSETGVTEAFLWEDGAMSGLGALDYLSYSESDAYDINDNGQIVGYSVLSNRGIAVYWDSFRSLVILQDLVDASGAGWELAEATAIDGNGNIVGGGVSPEGKTAAFLLTPVPGTTDSDADGYLYFEDCDDTDPYSNPDACDIKNDGIDQDCDGVDRKGGKPCSGDPPPGGSCAEYTSKRACLNDAACEWDKRKKICY